VSKDVLSEKCLLQSSTVLIQSGLIWGGQEVEWYACTGDNMKTALKKTVLKIVLILTPIFLFFSSMADIALAAELGFLTIEDKVSKRVILNDQIGQMQLQYPGELFLWSRQSGELCRIQRQVAEASGVNLGTLFTMLKTSNTTLVCRVIGRGPYAREILVH
jgi:hypothetical protein